ncbi:uncharacterized protein PHACADRAFT_201465 [Phanerochaete carnosa HHB-10118-sp]|uniref:homogentisate 1,2-dioxygenase n=1 Tax=Phanerochaete carnosa (strain HHB-10118-sp) TaxID=650164 RepID=K5VSM2_PHACS|nr:uncharacterized protein PHACADRAFT_201465 [Phanerochaete carnosa HHB-10118-sp]EKM49770.1 hypothetical protein PHACADRAFT_201465 [Phanerochaete carnosa HHB-10118-sp]
MCLHFLTFCFSQFYRIHLSVVHQGIVKRKKQNPYLVAKFSLNDPKQSATPACVSWSPDALLTNEAVNFIYGIKMMIENSSLMLQKGIVIHTYACNADMGKEAFVNSDGDFLIVPVQGRLDIQTELGKLMVFPGEIVVVQRGLKWKVTLPDGKAMRYIQEIFGMHYELPELSVISSHRLANPHNFKHLIAQFNVDQTAWEVIYKLGGQLFTCKQDHTPFDVVVWHRNYVPYKYYLDSFISLSSLTQDHVDLSIWTVLMVCSKTLGVSLANFAFMGERWNVTDKTFRPPFFHRNTASKIIGLITGDFEFSDSFKPGALQLETRFGAHGPDNTIFDAASNMVLKPMKVFEGMHIIMFEMSMLMSLTEYAAKDNRCQSYKGGNKGLEAKFLKHKEKIQADLKAAGLALIPGL